MMKLDSLQALCASIKKNNATYTVFTFTKNNVEFDIFFDIGVTPYALGFIVKKSNFDLWIQVQRGFIIEPFIPKTKFKQLITLLNLQYDPAHKFSTISFFTEFNKKIPSEYNKPNDELVRHVSVYKYDIEESDKLYFKEFKQWKDRQRSEANTEKTRLLYPEIYERIKDRPNISVAYTHISNAYLLKKAFKILST